MGEGREDRRSGVTARRRTLGRDVKSLRESVARRPTSASYIIKNHIGKYRIVSSMRFLHAGHCCTVAEHCVHMSACPHGLSTTCTGLSMQILHPLSPRAAPR